MNPSPAPGRIYADRIEAGRVLAQALAPLAGRDDTIVLALPRGGVPVAREVASALRCPLDVLIVRKVGVPGQPELAMGAIASGGASVVNQEIMDALGIRPAAFDRAAAAEAVELARRERAYRGQRPFPDLRGRVVILVDDGVATGATMLAGIRALRRLAPARIVAAIPHAPPDTCHLLGAEADELVCPSRPEPYVAVGRWYREFPQLSDDEVNTLLARAR